MKHIELKQVKWSGHEINHSPVSSGKVENEWSHAFVASTGTAVPLDDP